MINISFLTKVFWIFDMLPMQIQRLPPCFSIKAREENNESSIHNQLFHMYNSINTQLNFDSLCIPISSTLSFICFSPLPIINRMHNIAKIFYSTD